MSGSFSRAGVALAALVLIAAPAIAQTPARSPSEIMLTTGEAPVAVTVIGDIRAEAHQKSIMAKTSGRDLVNQQLRDQAAKMGADAVIDIKYEDSNPMFSQKGFIAVGKAVKFAPGATAAAAPTLAPAPAPVQTAAVQPALPTAVSPPPAVATVPAASPAPAMPAAIAAASGGKTPTALITVIDQDLPRPYTRLGSVSAEVHQTSLFPKTPTHQLLDEALRAKAAKLGADAVIMVKYSDSNALFSQKGSTAEGVAVKFAATTPATAPAPAPAQVAAAAPPPAPAPVQALTPSPAPKITAPPAPAAAATAPAAAPPTAKIMLSEQNVTRSYAVLGPVNSEVNQSTASLDKTGREVLDEDLRRQAAKLGADAVIMIKYAPAAAGRGPTAIGVAVKFN